MIRSKRSFVRPLRPALAAVLACTASTSLILPLFAAEPVQDSVPAVTASISPSVPAAYPAATAIRLAGDVKATRFIMDLDRKVELRAFVLADPNRVVLDVPQLSFQLPQGTGNAGRGLVKSFRYGQVVQGGSRIVMDLTGPAKIERAYVLDAENGQPPRLLLELAAVDKSTFAKLVVAGQREQAAHSSNAAHAGGSNADASPAIDNRPVVVIDPGHGGADNGTQAASGEQEKSIVLDFALTLRDRIEKAGKYRVVMTRTDDTFISLPDRVKLARTEQAALFISVHADALRRSDGDARGATIYTLSDKASDAEAERLADSENKADAIAGMNLTEEPSEVADILIDLAQRETKTFSNRFARLLVREMKGIALLHKHPLKSAGFRVLKAPDVPSVLIELGYVSNKADLKQLVSESWRSQTVGTVSSAVDAFFGRRATTAKGRAGERAAKD